MLMTFSRFGRLLPGPRHHPARGGRQRMVGTGARTGEILSSFAESARATRHLTPDAGDAASGRISERGGATPGPRVR